MRNAWSIAAVAIAAVLAVGCGWRARHSVTPLFSQPPYVGVACPTANSIACDRVGLAIWLRRPAARVNAVRDCRAARRMGVGQAATIAASVWDQLHAGRSVDQPLGRSGPACD
jgi:hypothetical protein